MLIAVTLTYFLLIFPFFISAYFYLNAENKLIKVEITLFGITIFKLSAYLNGTKIFIKKTFKKQYEMNAALLYKPKKMLVLKQVSLLSARFILETNIGENVFASLFSVYLINTLKNLLFDIIKSSSPSLKAKGDIFAYEGDKKFNAYLRLFFILNPITVIYNMIFFLTEKIKNGK